jgi:hypothetical protein
MRNEERKGSAVTSVIAALIFVLVLTIFGKSVHGAENQQPSNDQPPVIAAESSDIDSGYYRIHVLDEAKHHFIPSLGNLD